jgi:hypothetical protein
MNNQKFLSNGKVVRDAVFVNDGLLQNFNAAEVYNDATMLNLEKFNNRNDAVFETENLFINVDEFVNYFDAKVINSDKSEYSFKQEHSVYTEASIHSTELSRHDLSSSASYSTFRGDGSAHLKARFVNSKSFINEDDAAIENKGFMQNDKNGTLKNIDSAQIVNKPGAIFFNEAPSDGTTTGGEIFNRDDASITNDGSFENNRLISNENSASITNNNAFLTKSIDENRATANRAIIRNMDSATIFNSVGATLEQTATGVLNNTNTATLLNEGKIINTGESFVVDEVSGNITNRGAISNLGGSYIVCRDQSSLTNGLEIDNVESTILLEDDSVFDNSGEVVNGPYKGNNRSLIVVQLSQKSDQTTDGNYRNESLQYGSDGKGYWINTGVVRNTDGSVIFNDVKSVLRNAETGTIINNGYVYCSSDSTIDNSGAIRNEIDTTAAARNLSASFLASSDAITGSGASVPGTFEAWAAREARNQVAAALFSDSQGLWELDDDSRIYNNGKFVNGIEASTVHANSVYFYNREQGSFENTGSVFLIESSTFYNEDEAEAINKGNLELDQSATLVNINYAQVKNEGVMTNSQGRVSTNTDTSVISNAENAFFKNTGNIINENNGVILNFNIMINESATCDASKAYTTSGYSDAGDDASAIIEFLGNDNHALTKSYTNLELSQDFSKNSDEVKTRAHLENSGYIHNTGSATIQNFGKGFLHNTITGKILNDGGADLVNQDVNDRCAHDPGTSPRASSDLDYRGVFLNDGVIANENKLENHGSLTNTGDIVNYHHFHNTLRAALLVNKGNILNCPDIKDEAVAGFEKHFSRLNCSFLNQASATLVNKDSIVNGLMNGESASEDPTNRNTATLENDQGLTINSGKIVNYDLFINSLEFRNSYFINGTSDDDEVSEGEVKGSRLENQGTIENFHILRNKGWLETDGSSNVAARHPYFFNSGLIVNKEEATVLQEGIFDNAGTVTNSKNARFMNKNDKDNLGLISQVFTSGEFVNDGKYENSKVASTINFIPKTKDAADTFTVLEEGAYTSEPTIKARPDSSTYKFLLQDNEEYLIAGSSFILYNESSDVHEGLFTNNELFINTEPSDQSSELLTAVVSNRGTFVNNKMFENNGRVINRKTGLMKITYEADLDNSKVLDNVGSLEIEGVCLNSERFENHAGGNTTISETGSFDNADTTINTGTFVNKGTFHNEEYFVNGYHSSAEVQNFGLFDNNDLVNNMEQFVNHGVIMNSGVSMVAVDSGALTNDYQVSISTTDSKYVASSSRGGNLTAAGQISTTQWGAFAYKKPSTSADHDAVFSTQGTLQNYGQINNDKTLVVRTSSGAVSNEGGGVIRSTDILVVEQGSSLINSGTFYQLGRHRDSHGKTCKQCAGRLEMHGTFTTGKGGVFSNDGETLSDGDITVSGEYSNDGMLYFLYPGELNVTSGGKFSNDGELFAYGNINNNGNLENSGKLFLDCKGAKCPDVDFSIGEALDAASIQAGAQSSDHTIANGRLITNTGTLKIYGKLKNYDTIDNEGVVIVETATSEFQQKEGVFNNLPSAFFTNLGTTTIDSGASLFKNHRDATAVTLKNFRLNGPVVNQGRFENTEKMIVEERFTNYGVFQNNEYLRIGSLGLFFNAPNGEFHNAGDHFQSNRDALGLGGIAGSTDFNNTFVDIAGGNFKNLGLLYNDEYALLKAGAGNFFNFHYTKIGNNGAIEGSRENLFNRGIIDFDGLSGSALRGIPETRGNPNLALRLDGDGSPEIMSFDYSSDKKDGGRDNKGTDLTDGSRQNSWATPSDVKSAKFAVNVGISRTGLSNGTVAGGTLADLKCVDRIKICWTGEQSAKKVSVTFEGHEASKSSATVVESVEKIESDFEQVIEFDQVLASKVMIEVSKPQSQGIAISEIEVFECLDSFQGTRAENGQGTELHSGDPTNPLNNFAPELYIHELPVVEGSVTLITNQFLEATDFNDPVEFFDSNEFKSTFVDMINAQSRTYLNVAQRNRAVESESDSVNAAADSVGLSSSEESRRFDSTLQFELTSKPIHGKVIKAIANPTGVIADAILVKSLIKPSRDGIFDAEKVAPFDNRVWVPATTWSQYDIDAGLIAYMHSGDEASFEVLSFTVTDRKNGEIGGSLLIPVVLSSIGGHEFHHPESRHHVDDEAPIISVNTVLRLKEQNVGLGDSVENKHHKQLLTGTISPSELAATDVDTPDSKILFTVIEEPVHGRIILRKGNSEQDIQSFTQEQVRLGQVFFKQTSETRGQVLLDRVGLEVSDGGCLPLGEVSNWDGSSSSCSCTCKYNKQCSDNTISVTGAGDSASCASLCESELYNGYTEDSCFDYSNWKDNNGKTCAYYNDLAREDGGCRDPRFGNEFPGATFLLNSHVGHHRDLDVSYWMTPAYRREIEKTVDPNGVSALRACCLCGGGLDYQDGNKTSNLDLKCPGESAPADANVMTSVHYLEVEISPVDSQTPEEINNVILKLNEGNAEYSGFLTAEHLKYTDIDSNDAGLTYVITRSPSRGYIARIGQNGKGREIPISAFTQDELSAGNTILYVHQEDLGFGAEEIGKCECHAKTIVDDGDAWRKSQSDGSKRYKVAECSTKYTWNKPRNGDEYSGRFAGSSKPCSVNDFFEFAVIDTAAGRERGLSSSEPLYPVNIYDERWKHGAGPNPSMDNIFSILIDAVDTKTPEVSVNKLLDVNEKNSPGFTQTSVTLGGLIPSSGDASVEEIGKTGKISLLHLTATDIDTYDPNLIFKVTTPPKRGQIMLLGVDKDGNYTWAEKVQVSQWTQADINAGHVWYVHNKGETQGKIETDYFVFSVRDGLQKGSQMLQGQKFDIRILPVDDAKPVVTSSLLILNEKNEGEKNGLITPEILSASDVDTDDDQITFIVTYGENAKGWLAREGGLLDKGSINKGSRGKMCKDIDCGAGYCRMTQSGQGECVCPDGYSASPQEPAVNLEGFAPTSRIECVPEIVEDNLCTYNGDGECDDGGVGSSSNVCAFGTDTTDCGARDRHDVYCYGKVCVNGGVCYGNNCVCPPGYDGDNCEIPVECSSGCLEEMKGNGKCDIECDVADCEFDRSDCGDFDRAGALNSFTKYANRASHDFSNDIDPIDGAIYYYQTEVDCAFLCLNTKGCLAFDMEYTAEEQRTNGVCQLRFESRKTNVAYPNNDLFLVRPGVTPSDTYRQDRQRAWSDAVATTGQESSRYEGDKSDAIASLENMRRQDFLNRESLREASMQSQKAKYENDRLHQKVGTCTDYAGWSDGLGNNCGFYEENHVCYEGKADEKLFSSYRYGNDPTGSTTLIFKKGGASSLVNYPESTKGIGEHSVALDACCICGGGWKPWGGEHGDGSGDFNDNQNKVHVFTLEDIKLGRISYRHKGNELGDLKLGKESDSIDMKVIDAGYSSADNRVPDANTVEASLKIQINTVDRLGPYQIRNNGHVASERSSFPINISFTDMDSENCDIKYKISASPDDHGSADGLSLVELARTTFKGDANGWSAGTDLYNRINSQEDFFTRGDYDSKYVGGGYIGGVLNEDGKSAGDEFVSRSEAKTGEQSWRFIRGENSFGPGTPISPKLSVANASSNGDSGDVFKASFSFRAASATPDDSVYFVTGWGLGETTSDIVQRSSSFIIEIFHSVTNNGLQVRVVEEYNPDYLFYERRMAIHDPSSDTTSYKSKVPESDQYTASERIHWKETSGMTVTGGAIIGHPQCDGRIPGQCSVSLKAAKSVCESWDACLGFKCGTWNDRHNDCQLFGDGYKLKSADGVYTYDVSTYEVEDVDGCLGVKCGHGDCTDVPREQGAGFKCNDCPFGYQGNEDNTICVGMKNFQHGNIKMTPNDYTVVKDFLNPKEWHEVKIEVKYKPGCNNDRNENKGNDELSVWVDGEAAPYNQDFSSVAEIYGCALERHECIGGNESNKGTNEDRLVNDVTGSIDETTGKLLSSKKNIDVEYRSEASLDRVNSTSHLDDDFAVEIFSEERFEGTKLEQVPYSTVSSNGGIHEITGKTSAPLSIKVGRQCKIVLYTRDNFAGSTVTVEEGLFESLSQVRNGALDIDDTWSAKVVCWRNMDVPVVGLKFVASHSFSDTGYLGYGSPYAGDKINGLYFDDVAYSVHKKTGEAGNTVLDAFSTSFEGQDASGRGGYGGALNHGHLSVLGSEEEAINEFGECDVAQGKILFVPDSSKDGWPFKGLYFKEIGTHSERYMIDFTASDQNGNERKGQTLVVDVTPVDDKKPVLVTNAGMQVLEFNGRESTQTNLGEHAQGIPGWYGSTSLAQEGKFKYSSCPSGRADRLAKVDKSCMHDSGVSPANGTLSSYLLSAVDVDTVGSDAIVYSIVREPEKGYLAYTWDHSTRIDSFTQTNLIEWEVVFIHTSGEVGLTDDEDRFDFTIDDGSSIETDLSVHTFSIKILPVDNRAPSVSVVAFNVGNDNNPNGLTVTIDSSILSVSDVDTKEEDLIFVVEEDFKHGRLFIDAESFECINYPNYQGYNVESLDKFRSFRYSGMESSRAGGDSCPQNEQGCADAKASEDAGLGGFNGEIASRACCVCGGGITSGSVGSRGMMHLKKDDEFLSSAIESGILKYERFGIDTSENDVLKFTVKDGGVSGGVNKPGSFNLIAISGPPDTTAPVVEVNEKFSVNERDVSRLTTDFLMVTDDRSKDLSITITSPLKYAELRSVEDGAIDKFSLLDLAAGKILISGQKMEGDGFDVGLNTLTDKFVFSVSDDSGNSVIATFVVDITPQDSEDPVFRINEYGSLQVIEGQRASINTNFLLVTDSDSRSGYIFTLNNMPKAGKIFVNGAEAKEFTMMNVFEGVVEYVHDGNHVAPGATDTFSFSVRDDGGNDVTPESSTFKVALNPVDDKAPRVVVNEVLRWITEPNVGGDAIIQGLYLTIEDEDTALNNVFFTLTELPASGSLTKDGVELGLGDQWTQMDIDEERLRYKGVEIEAGEDYFSFTLEDSALNRADAATFEVKWAVLSLKPWNGAPLSEGETYTPTIMRSGDDSLDVYVKCLASGVGIENYAEQVSIVSGAREASCPSVQVLQDATYEREEQFDVRLQEALFSVIGGEISVVSIEDPEDITVIGVATTEIEINEETGVVAVVLTRSGDVTKEVAVECESSGETATGGDEIISGVDFEAGIKKAIFTAGSSSAECSYAIFDDVLREGKESFIVSIKDTADPTASWKLGEGFSTSVVIDDVADSSLVAFESESFQGNENDGFIKVSVTRTGADLGSASEVSIRVINDNDEGKAVRGKDFVSGPWRAIFPALLEAETSQTVDVEIKLIEDNLFEETKSFSIALYDPKDTIISGVDTALAVISDTGDEPVMAFAEGEAEVAESSETNEKLTVLQLKLVRSGDLRSRSAVELATVDGTGVGGVDFVVPAGLQATFQKGEREVVVPIEIINDEIFEGSETFKVVITKAFDGRIGSTNEVVVTVTDNSDETKVDFAESVVNVAEGETADVVIIRSGDVSNQETYFVSTKDFAPYASAESNKDYVVKAGLVTFEPGQRELLFQVKILADGTKETLDEEFYVTISSSSVSKEELAKTKVRITGERVLVFPGSPVVMTTTDYESGNPKSGGVVSPGENVVCVDACDKNHPEASKLKSLCDQAGITEKTERSFDWYVTPVSSSVDPSPKEELLRAGTVFTDIQGETLDSIYVVPETSIRCRVRPGTGVWSSGSSVSVGTEGRCDVPEYSSMRSRNFDAELTSDGGKLKARIRVPHVSGMTPLISTRAITDVERIIQNTPDRQIHQCSNLFTEGSLAITGGEANCLNVYEGTWDMSELLSSCGGSVVEDGFVVNMEETRLTVSVPLFVSYVYYKPGLESPWTHLDHQTEMAMTYTYNSNLFGSGIVIEASELKGSVTPTRVGLGSQGGIDIEFESQTQFRGAFLGSGASVEGPTAGVEYQIELIRDIDSFDTPTQAWRITSSQALTDYSGDYVIKLTPCTAGPSTVFTSDLPVEGQCSKQAETQPFVIPIDFSQTSIPVPAEHTLNAKFLLLSSEDLFLDDPSLDASWFDRAQLDSGGAFTEDGRIYGRLFMDPLTGNTGFNVEITSIYACAGSAGFVPQYNPDEGLYGCMQADARLSRRVRLLGSGSVDNYGGFDFDFQDAPEALKIQDDDDGFSIATEPFFAVESGYEWFIQVSYNLQANRKRRSSSSSGNNLLPLRLQREKSEAKINIRSSLVIDGVKNIAFAQSIFGMEAIQLALSQQLGVDKDSVEILAVTPVNSIRRRNLQSLKVEYRIVTGEKDVYGMNIKMQAVDAGLPALLRAQSPRFSGVTVDHVDVEIGGDSQNVDTTSTTISQDDMDTNTQEKDSTATSSDGGSGSESAGGVGVIVGAIVGVLVAAAAAVFVINRKKETKSIEKNVEEEVDLDGLEDFSVHGRAVQDGFESEI